MVHLPASNQFGKQFHDSELIGNCKDCVDRCKADLKEPGSLCSSEVDKWFEEHYVVAEAPEVMCENDALKQTLYGKKVPLEVKGALYRRPTLDPWTGEKDKRFDWDVPGIGHGKHPDAQETVKKTLAKKKKR